MRQASEPPRIPESYLSGSMRCSLEKDHNTKGRRYSGSGPRAGSGSRRRCSCSASDTVSIAALNAPAILWERPSGAGAFGWPADCSGVLGWLAGCFGATFSDFASSDIVDPRADCRRYEYRPSCDRRARVRSAREKPVLRIRSRMEVRPQNLHRDGYRTKCRLRMWS
jgi:hypothetical protein